MFRLSGLWRGVREAAAVVGVVAGSAIWFAAAPAAAAERTFHTFIISEVYSNADGSVQFIELRENLNFNGQHFLAGHALTAINAAGTDEHVFTFPTNLPSSATASRRVLIATPGFAALTGGIVPDYTIPAGFLFLGGGEVNFAGLAGGATVSYTALPSNGQSSLVFPGGAVAVNSPTNFAGASGSVNSPGGSCCVGTVCSIGTAVGCVGAFTQGGVCSPDPCAPAATGACCTGTDCTVSTAVACGAGSSYQGDSTACGPMGNPTTCCRANFNQSGGVTVQDMFDYLAAYFNGLPAADFNGVSGVTVQDIFDYLAAYFVGC